MVLFLNLSLEKLKCLKYIDISRKRQRNDKDRASETENGSVTVTYFIRLNMFSLYISFTNLKVTSIDSVCF